MESKALGQLVKAVFSNKEVRAEFERDPDKVAARFGLTDSERRAVVRTQTRLGLVTASGPKLETAIDPLIIWNSPVP